MGSNYFIQQGGQTVGPTSSFGLRTLAEAGKLAPTDLIWREGSERKVQAERVKGLSFASPPVVAPSPATVPEVSTPVQQVSAPPIYPVVSTTDFKRSSGSRSKSNLLAWNKMGFWLGIIGGIAALGLLVFAVTIFVNGKKSVEVENISTARVGYIIGDVRIDQASDYPGSAASYRGDVRNLLENRGFNWDLEAHFSVSASEVTPAYGEDAVMIVDTWWRSGNGSPGYLRLWWVHVPKRLAREVGGQDTPEEWLIHSIENADGQVYETGKTYFASEARNTEDANNRAGVVTERRSEQTGKSTSGESEQTEIVLAARKEKDPHDGMFLTLSGPQVTDADLVHLNGLTSLEELTLSDTKLTDTGLVHLKGLLNLNTLDLMGTEVTDAGLVHLKGLTNLERLNLRETKITDAGLQHLTGLKNLTYLNLFKTKVTDAGVAKLKKALPHCAINH